MSALLEVRGLVRRFGATTALDGLDLRVEPGEIYGLVGPDGAGKTTALRILAGVMDRDGGEVRVLGREPTDTDPELRRSLGYMPQQYSLYGDLTIDENLRFFARMFTLDKASFTARRARLLEITRLGRFADRRADALSGGMYKKLALSCALLSEPRLLLLDEPTNGVDPVSRRELWALLFEFAAEGMAIVVSTAYMDEAARCHRVGLLHRGRLLDEGRPEALLAAFEHPAFRVEGPDLDAAERALEGHEAVLTQSLSASELRIVVQAEAEPALSALLAPLGARLVRTRPDFEDVFLARTRSLS